MILSVLLLSLSVCLTLSIVILSLSLFLSPLSLFFSLSSFFSMELGIVKKLGSLPGDTKIYVGHEYTLANMKYALSCEPENEILQQKQRWAEVRRVEGLSTVPSTIAEEHETSPFMRAAFGKSKEIAILSGCKEPEDQILWARKDKSGGTWKRRNHPRNTL